MWNDQHRLPPPPPMPSVIGAAMPSFLTGGALGALAAGAGHVMNRHFPPLTAGPGARSGLGVGHGLMMLGAGLAAGGTLAGVAAGISQAQVNTAYREMLQRYPELAREDPTRVRELFLSVSRAAPDVAKDHIVAGSLIKRMLNYDGVDHATYMELVRTQESMAKTRATQLAPLTGIADVGTKFFSPLL